MSIYKAHTHIFNDSKYTKWYLSIIERAILRINVTGYSEKHHIIPKSICPELKNEKSNIVKLTAKEHFMAHLLLVKMVSGSYKNKMAYALWGMVNKANNFQQDRYKTSSRIYEICKKEIQRSLSSERKGKTLEELHGVEKATILRDVFKKRKTRSKMTEYEKEDCRRRIMKRNKEHPWKRAFEYGQLPKKECEKCGIIVDPGNYVRHHGNNCKNRSIEKECPTCKTVFTSPIRDNKKYCNRICAGTLRKPS